MILRRSIPRFLVGGIGFLLGAAEVARAETTYHVNPRGDDASDGKSPLRAWRTVARVNAQPLEPGDRILFERGGEWRECLVAGSSGAPGRPITFEASGTGPPPKFWGSDPVTRTRFEPAGDGVYRVAEAQPVHAVLVDHVFLRSARLVSKKDDPAQHRDHVRSHPGSWSWDQGVLHVNPGGVDPRTDPRAYTLAVRDDLVASNGRDHLVFRDLAVDESARFDAGYGFRIMGSADVRLERCAASRAGKHHFGVINSTGVVGVDLLAAVAMPDQGSGGASAYVSYSDATRRGDTSEYLGCTAERLDDPGTGGRYPAFVTHGAGIGSILLGDFTSRGGTSRSGTTSRGPRSASGAAGSTTPPCGSTGERSSSTG